jgi:acetyl esterase/lipase
MYRPRLAVVALAALIVLPLVIVSLRVATSKTASDGSILIENLRVPMPGDLSPQIRNQLMRHPWPHLPPAEQEAFMEKEAVKNNRIAIHRFGVSVAHEIWSAVPVNIVTPSSIAKGGASAILLHVHGGGFARCAAACSYSEAIPIAGLSGIKVVSVDYALAPAARFPVAVEQAVSVYRKLLKDHSPRQIAIFGSSAGATLSGEILARLIRDHIPVPAALGFFSGTADFSQRGDSPRIYALNGFASADNSGTELLDQISRAYAGKLDLRDSLLSPGHSDLTLFPPTLLMSSTRDILLSATSNFERALHRAGVRTQLVVFDGLYHTFWLNPGTPEADEALARQACFLALHVGVRQTADPACRLEASHAENH